MTFQINAQKWNGMELKIDQLLIGKDSFNMINLSGDKIGSMVIEGYKTPKQYIWKDISILDNAVYEETIYTFDQETYSLMNSTIEFNQGNTAISGNLNWRAGSAKGIYHILQGDKEKSINIDTTFSKLKDRAEVFAFINAIPLETGFQFPVNVLVQPNGEIWEMNVEIVAEEKCTVPAGEFDTYKINLTGGKLSNILYVSKGDKRKLVKVEVVGMPIVIEFVSSKAR